MHHAPRDMREIVDAVRIQSELRFSVSGEMFEVSKPSNGSAEIRPLLATMLYQRLYCRPSRGASTIGASTRASRVFIDELSRANSGTGTWELGWIVKAVENDGTLVVYKPGDGLTLWARPHEFRAADGAVSIGSTGRLHVGKELREMLPGYYTALGDADHPTDDEDERSLGLVRFYWHLTSAIAPSWMHELTRTLNAASVPFRAKVQSNPNGYLRADSGVLYVAHTNLAAVMILLPHLHQLVAANLRPTTPMFTRRLARGLAVAEDPGDGRSFGQHRTELVADALMRAFERGSTAMDDVVDMISSRFAEDGLAITRPWLNAGSRERYVWPARRAGERSRAAHEGR